MKNLPLFTSDIDNRDPSRRSEYGIVGWLTKAKFTDLVDGY